IDTAVKFLQNPRVRQTPMDQRRAFLQKKGLTKEEIEQAISQSGTAADEHNNPSTAVVPAQPTYKPGLPPPPPPPTTVPWRGYLGAAVIGGGLGYLLVNLVKTYIMPLIYDMNKTDEKLEKLEMAVIQTNASVTEAIGSVQTSLESVQEILVEQRKMIKSLSSDLAFTQDKLAGLPTDSYSVGDLKAEIVSLKGLLLNRKQFPPANIGSPQTGIPAWQRTTTPMVSFAKDVKGGDDTTQELDDQTKETVGDGPSKEHYHTNGRRWKSR
ncbi:hypothetical protein QZH41_014437, partial [Actinostola sp. cb2023]